MITIKSLRILDLALPNGLIVTEKYKILILIQKDKACDLSHSLEREGVCQGVQELSHAISSKAWCCEQWWKQLALYENRMIILNFCTLFWAHSFL